MLQGVIRQAATELLEAAIRVAPSDVRDWGRAMLGELHQVETGWATLSWALGGAGVLAKHALMSFLIPERRRHNVLPDGGLFAKNVSLRKVALLASAGYVLGALLFFAAPPFRQALRVSLAPWAALLHPASDHSQARIEAIAKRAKARHDPEGLVFAALRLSSARESARLTDEAIRIDPRLVWAYAIVAVRHPTIPEIPQWIPVLERWQPANALLPLITAESIRRVEGGPYGATAEGRQTEAGMVWQKAMAAAFVSPKFDDYLDRLQALDQRVARRYGFNNPEKLLAGEYGGLSAQCFSDVRRYALSVLESGDRLHARGEWKNAEASYWSVARFGQVMDSDARVNYEHWAGTTLQWMAYQRLESLSAGRGNTGQSALFAYLGKKFDPKTGDAAVALRKSVFGDYVARRNAFVLQVSALMMLVFSGLLISAAFILIAARRPREGSRRTARGVIVFVTLTSAVGLLLSSATVYLTYRPYWYILQGSMLNNGGGQSDGVRSFISAIHALPGLDRGALLQLPAYFWASVILAAIAALMLIFLRHFREPPRVTEAQPNSHVQ